MKTKETKDCNITAAVIILIVAGLTIGGSFAYDAFRTWKKAKTQKIKEDLE